VRVSSEIVSAVILDFLRMIEAFRDFIALYLDRGMDVASMNGYSISKQ